MIPNPTVSINTSLKDTPIISTHNNFPRLLSKLFKDKYEAEACVRNCGWLMEDAINEATNANKRPRVCHKHDHLLHVLICDIIGLFSYRAYAANLRAVPAV